MKDLQKRYKKYSTEVKCLIAACYMLTALNVNFIIQGIINVLSVGSIDAGYLYLAYIAPVAINAVCGVCSLCAACLFFSDCRKNFRMIQLFYFDGLVFSLLTSIFVLVNLLNGIFTGEEALSHTVFMLCTQLIDIICFAFFLIRFSVSPNTKYHFNLIKHVKIAEEDFTPMRRSNTDTAVFNVSSIKDALKENDK